ncbi:hypothetical protein Y1Q_0010329 [Alligator mississippiensis]|uniref:Uncharacterized protein n=1 Tax=Alligator mississippiensis TaxID=8496 RepID=A0A151NME0_ALLMI|nr:hypothetical protein Y1Q_0010329 [Alligator mississippiensis]
MGDLGPGGKEWDHSTKIFIVHERKEDEAERPGENSQTQLATGEKVISSNWCGVRLGTTEDDSHRTDLTSRWKKWSASKCLASLVENNKQEYEMFDPKKPYTEQGELVNWKC